MKCVALYEMTSHEEIIGMFSTLDKAREHVIKYWGSLPEDDYYLFWKPYIIDEGDAGEDGLYGRYSLVTGKRIPR